MLRPEIDQKFLLACDQGEVEFIQKYSTKEIGLDLTHLGLRGACLNNHRKTVKLLMEMGAWDFNSGLDGACLGGHIDFSQVDDERRC